MATAPDPRTEMEPTVRPVIETPRRLFPLWAIAAAGGVLGLGLFLELNAQRMARSAPPAKVPAATLAAAGSDLPPLYVPLPAQPPAVLLAPVKRMPEGGPLRAPSSSPTPEAHPASAPPLSTPLLPPRAEPPQISAQPLIQGQVARRTENSNEQVLLFDGTVGNSAMAANGGNGQGGSASGQNGSAQNQDTSAVPLSRARSGALLKRATIVPQGTLIPAVLETALDSTRAGGVRALVTRDVTGFDGARVVIPRGSRLYGEYRAELAPGQNRALVIWTRLVRPDGVSIALDSPAADPLGRNGIRGKVDSHFLERFSSALLQTALDIGSNVAARELSNSSSAVIALPGGLTSATMGSSSSPLLGGGSFQRTIRVRQGMSVSVFVSRDLDFTAVEAR